MSAILTLKSLADAGMRPTINDLTQAEVDELHTQIVPHGRVFTAGENALLGSYVLDVDAAASATIAAFNADSETRVALIEQVGGKNSISVKCLTYCSDGDPLNPIKQLLWSLPIIPNNPKPSIGV